MSNQEKIQELIALKSKSYSEDMTYGDVMGKKIDEMIADLKKSEVPKASPVVQEVPAGQRYVRPSDDPKEILEFLYGLVQFLLVKFSQGPSRL